MQTLNLVSSLHNFLEFSLNSPNSLSINLKTQKNPLLLSRNIHLSVLHLMGTLLIHLINIGSRCGYRACPDCVWCKC